MFDCFLSLILRFDLFNKIKENSNLKHYTISQALVYFSNYNKIIAGHKLYYTTLSKTQKQMFMAIGLPLPNEGQL
jgi:hypothetical protein